MPRFFTVHSRGLYSEGGIIGLSPVVAGLPLGTPTEFGAVAGQLFPEGVSEQGRQYLLRPWTLDVPDLEAQQIARDAFSEIIVELVRRDCAPEAPSRLESMFAFENLEDARWFKQAFRDDKGEIFAIDHNRGFRGDFTLLASLSGTPLMVTAYARRYWASAPHWAKAPRWELVLPLPVCIGEKVE